MFTVGFSGKFKDNVILWRKLYGSSQKRTIKNMSGKGE